jgi:hypothetical protein
VVGWEWAGNKKTEVKNDAVEPRGDKGKAAVRSEERKEDRGKAAVRR